MFQYYLVWCCFPLLGGANLSSSFWVVVFCSPRSFWVVLLGLFLFLVVMPSFPSLWVVVLFPIHLLPPSTPPPLPLPPPSLSLSGGAAFLSFLFFPPPSGGAAFSLFRVVLASYLPLGGAAFPPPPCRCFLPFLCLGGASLLLPLVAAAAFLF